MYNAKYIFLSYFEIFKSSMHNVNINSSDLQKL